MLCIINEMRKLMLRAYKKTSYPGADPDLQLGGPNYVMGVCGPSPQWGPGAKPLVKGSEGRSPPWSWRHFLISETNFLIKLSLKFWIFRLHDKSQVSQKSFNRNKDELNWHNRNWVQTWMISIIRKNFYSIREREKNNFVKWPSDHWVTRAPSSFVTIDVFVQHVRWKIFCSRDERVNMSAPAYNGQGVRGMKSLRRWRHFLISAKLPPFWEI